MVPYGYFPDGILLIRKVCSVNPSVTLANAEFKVTYADGTLIGDSNGIYRTDENGEIRIDGLKPGKSVIVTETRAPAGFILDTQSQTVQVREGRTVSLTFKNQPRGKLTIQKRDSQTNKPLPGAEFRVTTAAGCEVGLDGVIGTATLTQNGLFTTDSNGEIRISNLAPGAYVLTEVKAPAGYVMDAPSTNVVIGTNGDTQTVIIKNSKAGTLVIDKRDSVTGKPLAGVTFKVTTSTGEYVPDANGQISSNGLYFTDKDGKITINGVVGTLVVTETATIPGYTIDEATRTQTVVVNPNDTQTLHFTNTPSTTLIIRKFIEGTANEPLAGVGFKVVDGSGAAVGPDDGVYYTDHAGEIVLDGIEPGTTVIAREIKTVDGFVLDGVPQDIKIEPGRVQQLTFWNKRAGTLLIEKLDSVTKAPLKGAQFKVTYADGRVVDTEGGKLSSNGIYFTDSNGQIKITNVTGTIVVTEEKAPDGYVIGSNDKSQTVVVNPQDTQTLRFYNDPLCSLTITKLDSVSGKPVLNTEFTVKDGNGNVLGRYTTGKDGTVTVTGLIPNSTVVVVESKVPSNYVLDPTPHTTIVRNGGNSLSTGTTGGGSTNVGGNGNTGTGSGNGNNITVENVPKVTLTIEKYLETESGNVPLKGVTFLVTDQTGAVIGNSNGEFTSDENGRIVIPNLEPGTTVTAREIKVPEGVVLDSSPKSILIKAGEQSQTLRVVNKATGYLVIKKLDKINGKPLAGVEFKLTYASGEYVDDAYGHLSSLGLYTTDQNGEIRVPVVGTIVVEETKCLPGYTIDPGTQRQVVTVNPADTQTLKVYNAPIGGVEIIKVNEADKTQRIPNVTFEIRKMDGALVDTVTTGKTGNVYVSLEDGSYYAVETDCPSNFKLDSTPHYFEVKDGKATSPLVVTNKAFSGILLHKIDSATKTGIYGATFLLYDANKNPIGQYSSDDKGFVYIDDLASGGRYYLRELENEGYIVDTQLKTVYVTPGTTTEITWENTAITGQIQITKTSADYNSMNGWPAGTPIPNTEFEIYHYRTGNLVDTIRTDKNGVAVSKPLPLGRYKVVESKSADFYGLDKTPIDLEIEHAGQIVKTAMTNKALYTNVSIKKTGFVEVMPGQQIRYDFSGIANNSTTALTSFYWRDTLPTQAVRLDKIVTGTYNVQENYKIVFKTNLSGEYRTMYDNLSTMQNYVLDASPAALGLASNECVTEFMVSFGVVPANFRQVEAPKVYCNVLSGLTGGTQFVNQADLGGVYNGQWIMATSRWVTRVYKPSKPLPRTGY